MPRVARVVVPGVPHHVTQRGDNRQEVFFVDDDHGVYLELLAGQAQRFGLDVLGYCLMSNHVHLMAVPQREESLAKAIGRTHFLYTQYLQYAVPAPLAWTQWTSVAEPVPLLRAG